MEDKGEVKDATWMLWLIVPRARCLEVPIFHGARQVEAHSQVSGSYFEDDRLVFQCEQPSSTPRSFIFTCKNGRWQGETPTCG